MQATRHERAEEMFEIDFEAQHVVDAPMLAGKMVGHNVLAKNFKSGNNKIYIGNPLMILSGLKIQTEILSSEEVKKEYFSMRPVSNQLY